MKRRPFHDATRRAYELVWFAAAFLSVVALAPVGGATQAPLNARAVADAFTIGADPADDLARGAFGSVGAAAIAADGSVYVIDSGECRVKHFSTTGKFVHTFGRSGGGPGEFGGCRNLRISVTSDGVNVTDPVQNRLTVFTRDGNVTATRSLPSFPGDIGLYRSSALRYGFSLRTESGIVTQTGQRRFTENSFLVLRRLGETRADTIAMYRQDAVFIELTNGRGTTAPTGLGYAGAWTVCGDSVAVFADGYTDNVTWHAITPAGLQVTRTAHVGRAGAPVSDGERRALVEKVRTSAHVVEDARRFGGGGIRSISDPPRMSSVVWTVRCMSDGAVWVGMQREAIRTEWAVFPASTAAYAVTLPPDFYFLSARDRLIVGRSATPSDIPVLRALRIAER